MEINGHNDNGQYATYPGSPPLPVLLNYLETSNRTQKSMVQNSVDEITMAAACLYAIVEEAGDNVDADRIETDQETTALMLGALRTHVARLEAQLLQKGSLASEVVYAQSQFQSWYPTMREARAEIENWRERGILAATGMVNCGGRPFYHLFSMSPQLSIDYKHQFKANEFIPTSVSGFATLRSFYQTIPESLRIFK